MTEAQQEYLRGVRRTFIALAGVRVIGAGFDRFDLPMPIRYALLPVVVIGALVCVFGTRLDRLPVGRAPSV